MVDRKQQILMMGGGLMVAFGFMFMGAASLSGLTPSGTPQQDSGQQINATLPEQNYAEDGFQLGVQEQAYLAVNNQVVFVNAIYQEDAEVFSDIEDIHEEFDGRVYFSKVNESDTDIDSDLQVTEFPEIIVVGDQPTRQSPYSLRRAENNRESVIEAICGSMRDVGDAAATCY